VNLKLLSYNIRYGGVKREQPLAAVIRQIDPHLVVLQEATRPQVVERLANELGMKAWASRPGHSLAFLSRIEIAHHEWHRPPGTRHHFLELAPAGLDFRVFGLHLSAVHSNWTERRRVRELGATLGAIERHRSGFHVLAGDFNTLAPGEALDLRKLPPRLRALVWLSGRRLRWETIQIMLDGGYVDGYRALHPDDRGYTFPTWDPHVRLDYFFLPAAHAARLTACEIVRDGGAVAEASDHFPLLAHLNMM
jgi:endonuclease/exonuclease/phosphatase family metal-dependent hydrolase